jgi:quercetin dioxygenase-like cupin family protein
VSEVQPVIVPVGQRQAFALGGSVFNLIARAGHTGGQFALYETMVPPSGGSAAHVHSRESESFLMLEGVLTVAWSGRALALHPGDFVTFPAGCIYGFRNEGTDPARFLTLLVPAGLDDFLASVGAPVAADTQPAAATPAEAEHLVLEARRYGVEYPR